MKNKTKPKTRKITIKAINKGILTASLLLAILSTIFLRSVWSASLATKEERTLEAAEFIAVSLNGEIIKNLHASPKDVDTASYKSIKDRLDAIKTIDRDVSFAYIYTMKEGIVYFMADSAPANSEDYSPPGQEYTEADAETKEAFNAGISFITQPSTDRWGTWVSALVPIKAQTGEVLAVFGLDYTSATWYSSVIDNTLHKAFWVLAAYSLLLIFYILIKKNTLLKEAHQQLQLEKDKIKTTLLSLGDGVISTDNQGNVTVLNKVAGQLTGWTQDDALGKPLSDVFDVVNELTHVKCNKIIADVLEKDEIVEPCSHSILISKDGTEMNIEITAAAIKDGYGTATGVVLIFRDITQKRKSHKEIEFLSYYDPLTGLHNRRYYEKEMQRLNNEKYYPLTLVMADVNGLKLTNDAFGHGAGDLLLQKIAAILKRECRAQDIVARIGGDEFVILLPETDVKHADIIIARINEAIAKEPIENFPLSVSVGSAVKKDFLQDMNEVFKEAENDMYRNKLSESTSMRSRTIDVILNSLFEKNPREMLHSKRVSELCDSIAQNMNFTKMGIVEIKLAGLMHDIGKIGINEEILSKTGKLSPEEWLELKRHPEIGYRILGSVIEFSQISEHVLAHHERIDGKGYPKGLSGDEIPLQAKIIALADSYDAMISERSYKNSLSKSDAIIEIKRCSGTQFDPEIARVFVEKVLGEKW